MATVIQTCGFNEKTPHLILRPVINQSMLINGVHYIFILFGFFLLMQDFLTAYFGDTTSLTGKLVKMGDEGVTLLFSIVFCIVTAFRVRVLIRKKIDFLIFLFLCTGVLSSLWAQVPFNIFSCQLFLYLKGFIIYFILANLPITEKIMKKYVRFFGWIAIIFFGLGLINFIVPEWFQSHLPGKSSVKYRFGIPSVKALFVHPGIFGWFMAFTGLYFFAFFLAFKKWRYFWTAILLTLGSAMSMRRKSVGGIILGLMSASTVQTPARRSKYLLFFFVTLIVLTIAAWPKVIKLYEWTQEEYFGRPMQVARIVLHIKSLDIAEEYFPMGAGFGRFGSWMSRVYYSPLYDQYGISDLRGLTREAPTFMNDSFWPMILGETGFIGLILYLSIMICFLVSIAKLSRKARIQGNKYAFAFLLGTLMIVVESLFESVAQSIYMGPPANLFIFGAIGLSFSIGRNLKQPEL